MSGFAIERPEPSLKIISFQAMIEHLESPKEFTWTAVRLTKNCWVISAGIPHRRFGIKCGDVNVPCQANVPRVISRILEAAYASGKLDKRNEIVKAILGEAPDS